MEEIILQKSEAEVIRSILKEEKMTVKELADRMGVVRQSVNQSLNGTMKSMRCDTFKKMCEACGYEVVVRKIG